MRDKPGLKRDRGGLTDMLRADVGFNDDQVKQYKELKDAQWNTIRPMFDDMRKAKDSLYRLIGVANVSDSMVKAAASAIGEKQEELDLKAFEHFKKVRTLCTVEQQPKYDSMIVRMFRKMGKQPRKPGENKDDKKQENQH